MVSCKPASNVFSSTLSGECLRVSKAPGQVSDRLSRHSVRIDLGADPVSLRVHELTDHELHFAVTEYNSNRYVITYVI